MLDARMTQATELMTAFAERTGIVGDRAQKRYLWTDAFAVCNFIALGREDLARHLVDCVHRTLGRYRDDDARVGWLGGDEAHPTRRGLRIGKPLPERGVGDPFSEHLEWERDGQYFHYLTKWMHALDVLARRTRSAHYNRWATDLAVVAHDRFTHSFHGAKRLYWKMSTDLSRPLVASMGHHDALDGFITAAQLASAPPQLFTDYASMLELGSLATADPLGLGGLLVDVCRVHQLVEQQTWMHDVDLLDPLLDAALLGLKHFVGNADFDAGAHRRLAFRELGLAIGLAGIERLHGAELPRTTTMKLALLSRFVPLRSSIEAFWLEPQNRQSRTWLDHADINDVMLATTLVPAGFLELPPRSRARAVLAYRSSQV